MNDDRQRLGVNLLQTALDRTDSPDEAVSVLMSAAATILQRSFGCEGAIELMHHALDETGAAVRAAGMA